jgi:L-malate glycosyltransferase
MNDLILVGSNSIHLVHYANLVENYFNQIYLITDQEEGPWKNPLLVTSFSLRNPLNLFKTVHAIRQSLKKIQPAFVHVHQANSFAWYTSIALRGLNIPWVLTVWGSDVLIAPHRSWWLKQMLLSNLNHAHAITADSKELCTQVNLMVRNKQKTILLANFGVAIDPLPLEKEKLIYSNRLHKPLYRIDRIIQAFNELHHKDPRWQLVIAASGEQTAYLKKMARSAEAADHIHFTGWINQSEQIEYYSKALLYVSLPESDGTSSSLLEAMACGCIPVVSDLPANREWIDDMVNGVLVAEDDPDFFGRALDLDQCSVEQINREIIRNRGSRKVNAAKFIQLYQSLISK